MFACMYNTCIKLLLTLLLTSNFHLHTINDIFMNSWTVGVITDSVVEAELL